MPTWKHIAAVSGLARREVEEPWRRFFEVIELYVSRDNLMEGSLGVRSRRLEQIDAQSR